MNAQLSYYLVPDNPLFSKRHRRDMKQDSAKTEYAPNRFQPHVINASKRRFTSAPPEASSV
jgi:hypothetical protein